MYIVYLAGILASALTATIAFLIENISGWDVVYLILCFLVSFNFLGEILKLTTGKNKIDNSKKPASIFFGELWVDWWERLFFINISILNAKGRELKLAWRILVGSLISLILCIIILFLN
jgi:hypothetical protein